MTTPSREDVLARLDRVVDPCSAATVEPMSLVRMGLIQDVTVSDEGAVRVDLRLTSPGCFMIAFISTEATRLIAELPGVTSVSVFPDEGLDWTPDNIDPETAARRSRGLALLGNPAGVR